MITHTHDYRSGHFSNRRWHLEVNMVMLDLLRLVVAANLG